MFSTVLFYILSILYPLIVFGCLVVFKVDKRIFSLFIIFFGLLYLLLGTAKKDFKKNKNIFISAAGLLFAGLICYFFKTDLFIRLYPLLMTLVFLWVFAVTLIQPPNICFRLANLTQKDECSGINRNRILAYTKKVTWVWVCYFILNGIITLFTIFYPFPQEYRDTIWSVYNGGIAYINMGILFSVEFIIRKVVQSKMPKSFSISKFTAKSWPQDRIICYERKWSDKKFKTWKDFLTDSAKLRAYINSFPQTDKWILHCEDYWYFICCYVSLLQCKKEILLTANISPSFVAEIQEPGVRFFTDQTEVEGKTILNSDFVPDLITKLPQPSEEEINSTPKIAADQTRIVMHTSGSTGKPKKVLQRLTEFEADNAFILSKWGDEFLSRKLCATVSQHHIYGLLFTMMIPFTIGLPFRRKRIEFPEEFELLDDEKYMIIAVPAFLKRTCAELKAENQETKLPLREPWIFTSGGVLLPEVAQDTEKLFGFCPLEVYGSTETSGIAYRQQTKDGSLWTPFDNAKIWCDKDDGCLTIISPYIKDPAGFKTGDLAEIQQDGRFILKGRADSIVKIEEKRISLPEVEMRLNQSGLVADCCVVAMADRRQYLAAAVVLNEEGKKKFAGTEKYLINRYFHDFLLQYFENVVLPKKWRFMDKIPCDVQGKKHKLEIQSLFTEAKEGGENK